MSVELMTLLIWAVDVTTPSVIGRTNVVSNKKRVEQTTPHRIQHSQRDNVAFKSIQSLEPASFTCKADRSQSILSN